MCAHRPIASIASRRAAVDTIVFGTDSHAQSLAMPTRQGAERRKLVYDYRRQLTVERTRTADSSWPSAPVRQTACTPDLVVIKAGYETRCRNLMTQHQL